MLPISSAPTLSFLTRAARGTAASRLALAVAGSAALALGCSSEPAPEITRVADRASTPGEAAPPRAEKTAGVARHTLGAAVDADLEKVELRPQQAAPVEQLRRRIRAHGLPVQDAKGRLASALAAQVLAGAVDKTALTPLVDDISNAAATDAREVQAALAQLHAVLDDAQRLALTREMHAKHARGAAEAMPAMNDLTRDLELSPSQVRAVIDSLNQAGCSGATQRPATRGSALATFADAFAGGSFDATTLELGGRSPESLRNDALMTVAMAGTLTAMLDAPHRALLADRLVARSKAE